MTAVDEPRGGDGRIEVARPSMTGMEVTGGPHDGAVVLIEATPDGAPPVELYVDRTGAVWDRAGDRVIGQAEHGAVNCGQFVAGALGGMVGPCVRPLGHDDAEPATERNPHRADTGAKWWTT